MTLILRPVQPCSLQPVPGTKCGVCVGSVETQYFLLTPLGIVEPLK